MTSTLVAALKAMDVVREGYVVRNMDGTAMSDAQTSHETYRICRKAQLPERGWHVLRHTSRHGITARFWREPVEADGVDGAQAYRRDDGLRARRSNESRVPSPPSSWRRA